MGALTLKNAVAKASTSLRKVQHKKTCTLLKRKEVRLVCTTVEVFARWLKETEREVNG